MISPLTLPKQYRFSAKLQADNTSELVYENLGGKEIVGVPRQLVVTIRVLRPLQEYDGLPYAFEFLPPVEGDAERTLGYRRTYPIIRIVAAPGVSITTNFSPYSTYGSAEGVERPFLDVVRVQDPAQIPPLAREISTLNYEVLSIVDLQTNGPLFSDQEFSVFDPNSMLYIEHKLDGMEFSQPQFNEKLVIKVPRFSTVRSTREGPDLSANARFAYKFLHDNHSLQPVVLRILITKGVDVKLHYPRKNQNDLNPARLNYELFIIDDLIAFSQMSSVFYCNDNKNYTVGKRIGVPHIDGLVDELSMAANDATLGSIPIFGDLYDFAQFIYGVSTGQDFYGRTLTKIDYCLLALGILPLVSAGMLRGVKSRAARELGPKFFLADKLRGEIELSPQLLALSEAVSPYVKTLKEIPPELTQQATKMLSETESAPRVLDDLLNAEKTGFRHSELQEAYSIYCKTMKQPKKQGKVALSPEGWLRKQNTGKQAERLRSLLGKDFRKVKAATKTVVHSTVNNTGIPRPQSLNDTKIRDLLRQLLASEKLFDRIPPGSIVNGVIDANLFNTLVGNVGEILARSQFMLKRLNQLQDGTLPKFELLEDVKIALKNSNGEWEEAKLFSDGIIAQVHKNGVLDISDIFEVKAGKEGGIEATKQIFNWIEGRIEDGARLITKDSRVFEYFPDVKSSNKPVVNLMNAQRHIVTVKGKSHLGRKSGDQIAKPPIREEVDINKKEIDYLTRLIMNSQQHQLDLKLPEMEYITGLVLAKMGQ